MASELRDIKMDPATLYREEVVTDRRVGTIRVLTPIKADGKPDGARQVIYVGETQVLTPGGMLPIAFELKAATLSEAVEKFGDAAKEALEQTIQEIQQLRREAASSIVIPDRAPSGLITPPGGPGVPPRGGKIQLP